MPDRDKVIKGLECCMKWTGKPNTATCHCSDCSYTNMDILGERCLIDLINDALSLLKEQEAVEPMISCVEQRCRNCNKVIEMDGWKACPWCGKPIDWKGWWKKNGTRNQNS